MRQGRGDQEDRQTDPSAGGGPQKFHANDEVGAAHREENQHRITAGVLGEIELPAGHGKNGRGEKRDPRSMQQPAQIENDQEARQ